MKKLYSSILMQLVLALCTFNFIACQEFNIDSQPEGPLNIQIDAQDTYTVLATAPSNVVFNISANTPWTITSDQQWCKPTPAMSAASSLVSEIVVAIESNTGLQSRTAKLTIKAEGIEGEKVVTITQVSKEKLVLRPKTDVVPTEGGTFAFTISSNKPWEIIPSDGFISAVSKMSGEGTIDASEEEITITLTGNSGARRQGTITVRTAFEEETLTVTQDGVIIEQETPSETGTIDFGGAASEQIIKIRANKAWKVKVPQEYADWITAEALSTSELKISLRESNRIVTRKGQVLLSTVDMIPGFEGVSFDITQKSQFYFSGTSYEVNEETGNVKVTAGNTQIISHYAFKKEHLTFEFEGFHLTEKSKLFFNMYPNKGNSNFNFTLPDNGACSLGCGGGFDWAPAQTFKLTPEEVSAIRKIEFYLESDPVNTGKLRIRVLINGVEKAVISNRTNSFEKDPELNPGQVIYLQPTLEAGSYYIIKSVTRESVN